MDQVVFLSAKTWALRQEDQRRDCSHRDDRSQYAELSIKTENCGLGLVF